MSLRETAGDVEQRIGRREVTMYIPEVITDNALCGIERTLDEDGLHRQFVLGMALQLLLEQPVGIIILYAGNQFQQHGRCQDDIET